MWVLSRGCFFVFFVNEFQADPVHVVVSLVFMFISNFFFFFFFFEFAGLWDMPEAPIYFCSVCVCAGGGGGEGVGDFLWDLVLGKEVSYCDAVWSYM